MERGHSAARQYPIAFLMKEAELARLRANQDLASEMTMIQLTIASTKDRRSLREFKKKIKELAGGR